MLKDASRRKFDIVMAWAIDRLGRSLIPDRPQLGDRPVNALKQLRAGHASLLPRPVQVVAPFTTAGILGRLGRSRLLALGSYPDMDKGRCGNRHFVSPVRSGGRVIDDAQHVAEWRELRHTRTISPRVIMRLCRLLHVVTSGSAGEP